MGFADWVNDLRWSSNMRRARRYRRGLSPMERQVFDKTFCQMTPSAVYHVTIDDFCRGVEAVIAYRFGWGPEYEGS